MQRVNVMAIFAVTSLSVTLLAKTQSGGLVQFTAWCK